MTRDVKAAGEPVTSLTAFPHRRQQSLSAGGSNGGGGEMLVAMPQDHPLYSADTGDGEGIGSGALAEGLRGGQWDRKKPHNDLHELVADTQEQWAAEEDIVPQQHGAVTQAQVPSYYQPPNEQKHQPAQLHMGPPPIVTAATVAISGGAVSVSATLPSANHQGANAPVVATAPAGAKLKRSLLSSKEVHLLLLHASRLGDVHALRSLLRSPKMTPHMSDDHGRTPLMFAAFGGHEECVLFLIGRGALVHETDFAGKTALHYACAKGYVHIIALLLKSGANPWLDDHQGQCALHAVSEQESVDAFELVWKYARAQVKDNLVALTKKQDIYMERRRQWRKLLAANRRRGGRDTDIALLDVERKHQHIDIHDDAGLTPLMCAVIRGHLEIVKALVGYGADITSEAAGGRTALHFAINNNHTTITQFLVSKCPDLVDKEDVDGLIPLHWAAMNGQLSQIYFLLMFRSSLVHTQNFTGKTCVHLAIENGHQSSLKLLTQFSAPLETPDESGNQPLHLATMHNYRDCMSILLKNGVDVDAGGHQSRTALHIAAQNNFLDAAKLLIQRSANVNATDINGETPLHLAAAKGLTSICILLLKENAISCHNSAEQQTPLFKAVVNGHPETALALINDKGKNALDVDGKGRTVLHLCAAKGHIDMCALFIKMGVKVTIQDQKGATALHEAAFYGHSDILAFLIEQGADVAARDFVGVTALHWAAVNGHQRCCELLIQAGAPVNVIDYDGDAGTPLDYAYLNENIECVKLLQKHGGLRAEELLHQNDAAKNSQRLPASTKKSNLTETETSPPSTVSIGTEETMTLLQNGAPVSVAPLPAAKSSKAGGFERVTKSLDRAVALRQRAFVNHLSTNTEREEQERIRDTLKETLERMRQMKLQTVNQSSSTASMDPVTSTEIQNSINNNSGNNNILSHSSHEVAFGSKHKTKNRRSLLGQSPSNIDRNESTSS